MNSNASLSGDWGWVVGAPCFQPSPPAFANSPSHVEVSQSSVAVRFSRPHHLSPTPSNQSGLATRPCSLNRVAVNPIHHPRPPHPPHHVGEVLAVLHFQREEERRGERAALGVLHVLDV